MYLDIIREDITKLKVDAIVNPSNPYLIPGDLNSVSGQIYQQAGYEQLDEATRIHARIDFGEAVITDAFDLECKHVILLCLNNQFLS